MGCGASTTQDAAQEKYVQNETLRSSDHMVHHMDNECNPLSVRTKGSSVNEAMTPPAASVGSMGQLISPRPNSNGFSTPRELKAKLEHNLTRVCTLQDLNASRRGGSSTVSLSFPERRFATHFDNAIPAERKLLSRILSGTVTIRRPSNCTASSTSMYYLDSSILPDLTLSLTSAELQRVMPPQQMNVSFSCTIDNGSPLDLLAARCIKAHFKTGSLRWLSGHSRPMQSLALTPDLRLGCALVAGGRKVFEADTPRTGGQTDPLASSIKSPLASTPHNFLDSYEMSITCFDLRTANTTGVLRSQDMKMYKEIAYVFGKTSDPCLLAAPARGGVTVFSTSRYSVQQELPYEADAVDLGMITCMTVSQDSRFAAVGGQAFDESGNLSGAVLVWAATERGPKIHFTVERCFLDHVGVVTTCAFHMHDPVMVSGDAAGTVLLWHIMTGEVIQEIAGAKNQAARKFTFCGEDHLVGLIDGQLKCWVSNGKEGLDLRYEVAWTKVAGQKAVSGSRTSVEADAEPKDASYRGVYALPGNAIMVTTSINCFVCDIIYTHLHSGYLFASYEFASRII